MNKPHRRLECEIKVGADDKEALLSSLRHIISEIEGYGTGCTCGGSSSGFHYSVSEDPSVTHDSYFAALREYLDSRAADAQEGEGPSGAAGPSQATPCVPPRCRRCSECRDASHHWMHNGDFGNDDEPEEIREADFVCKHCDQLGRECPTCYGDGVDAVDDGPCDNCEGEGVKPIGASVKSTDAASGGAS